MNFKRVVKRDAKLVPIWNTVFQARAVLAKFMEVTSELSFTHSRESAERLIASIEEYKKELSAYLSDHEKTLDLGWVLKVEKQLNEFEILFERESEKINAFSVSKKGIYDTEALIERAHESLPLSVVSRLSKETIEDINQAGRCLALDSPTAAGFHILRAVESLIRIYHEKLTKKALALKSRNWGSYIRDLNDASADQKNHRLPSPHERHLSKPHCSSRRNSVGRGSVLVVQRLTKRNHTVGCGYSVVSLELLDQWEFDLFDFILPLLTA